MFYGTLDFQSQVNRDELVTLQRRSRRENQHHQGNLLQKGSREPSSQGSNPTAAAWSLNLQTQTRSKQVGKQFCVSAEEWGFGDYLTKAATNWVLSIGGAGRENITEEG